MIKEINQFMDYIEDHLTETLDPQAVAKNVGLSEYHFRRIFSFMAGMPLNEYIRKRRLARANEELAKGAGVTDVAFAYGYQSVEGFSRAFREWSGQLPSEVVKTGTIKSFPKLTFYLTIRGGEQMDVQIEQKAAFKLAGVTKRVPIQFEGVNPAIQELAESITDEQRQALHQLMDSYPKQVVNASYDFDEGRMTGKGQLTHLIGAVTTQHEIPEILQQVAVPAAQWAVFKSEGAFPAVMQETWGKIYSEWLPSVDYQMIPLPEISFVKMAGDGQTAYSEIWLAVTE